MKKLLAISCALAIGSSGALAQAVDRAADEGVCKAQEDALSQLESKYKAEQDHLKEESDDIKLPNPTITGEIKFEDAHTALNLPQVTMRTRRFAFDTPQVTMRRKEVKFDVPETRSKRVEIGRNPQTTCRWRNGIPRCTVRWRPIYTDIPEIVMITRAFSTDIPEVRMATTNVSFDVPDVTMKRVDMYYKLPHVTIKNPMEQPDDVEEKSKKIEAEAQALAGKINADAAEATAALYSCHTQQLVSQRDEVSRTFNDAISQINTGIDNVRNNGGNPEAVASEGTTVNLVKQRNDLLKERDEALAKLDDAIKQLSTGAEKDVSDAVKATET